MTISQISEPLLNSYSCSDADTKHDSARLDEHASTKKQTVYSESYQEKPRNVRRKILSTCRNHAPDLLERPIKRAKHLENTPDTLPVVPVDQKYPPMYAWMPIERQSVYGQYDIAYEREKKIESELEHHHSITVAKRSKFSKTKLKLGVNSLVSATLNKTDQINDEIYLKIKSWLSCIVDDVPKQLEKCFVSLTNPDDSMQVRAALKRALDFTRYLDMPDMANISGNLGVFSFIVAVEFRGYLYIANLGNCRAILCGSDNEVHSLSADHVKDSPAESTRERLAPMLLRDNGLTRGVVISALSAEQPSSRVEVSRVSLRQIRGKELVLVNYELLRVLGGNIGINQCIEQWKKDKSNYSIAQFLLSSARKRYPDADNMGVCVISFQTTKRQIIQNIYALRDFLKNLFNAAIFFAQHRSCMMIENIKNYMYKKVPEDRIYSERLERFKMCLSNEHKSSYASTRPKLFTEEQDKKIKTFYRKLNQIIIEYPRLYSVKDRYREEKVYDLDSDEWRTVLVQEDCLGRTLKRAQEQKIMQKNMRQSLPPQKNMVASVHVPPKEILSDELHASRYHSRVYSKNAISGQVDAMFVGFCPYQGQLPYSEMENSPTSCEIFDLIHGHMNANRDRLWRNLETDMVIEAAFGISRHMNEALYALKYPDDPRQVRAALKKAVDMNWYEQISILEVHYLLGLLPLVKAIAPDSLVTMSGIWAVSFRGYLYMVSLGACRSLLVKRNGQTQRLSVEHLTDAPGEEKRRENAPPQLRDYGLTRGLTLPSTNTEPGRRAQVSRIPLSQVTGNVLVLMNPHVASILTDEMVASYIQEQPRDKSPQDINVGLYHLVKTQAPEADQLCIGVWTPPPSYFQKLEQKFRSWFEKK